MYDAISKQIQSTVRLIYTTEATKPQLDDAIQTQIEENWTRLNEARQGLFNGTLLRVISQETKDDCTEILVAPDTSYKEIVGLRYTNGDETSGLDSKIDLQVLSAYVIVVSKDGIVFLINRDDGDWNKAVEFPGGFIQAKYAYKDPKEFAVARVLSDLGGEELPVSEAQCLGFIDAKDIFEMVLVYKVQSHLTFEELKQKSNVELLVIPEGYTVARHSEFFDKKIHRIMNRTLFGFLEEARGK
jgi:predicted XRE-type DNA-binding protein